MNKFLFIPQPLPEESPTSMLKRMAIKHGCVFNSDYQHLFGDSWHQSIPLSKSHPITRNIAIQAGEAREDFLSGFYSPIGALQSAPPLRIAGITVEAGMIRKRGAAFCSECWREGREHFIKDLKLARYCPYHNRKYLTKCSKCHRHLRWHVPLTERCRCNHLLISPPCTLEDAASERKLLSIFRAGASDDFQHLIEILKNLGYPLGRDTQCPAERCLKSIAFCILEDNMMHLTSHLRELALFYPEIPKRILAAKLSRFNDVKIRNCVHDFLKQHNIHTPEHHGELPSVCRFYLTRRQIIAWLKIRGAQWEFAANTLATLNRRYQYDWKEAQAIAVKVLTIRLKNGFKKKKKSINGIFKKDVQEKLLISAGAVKNLINEHFLTRIWDRHRIYFDTHEIEEFSKNFISIRLLSSQTNIPEKKIRLAIKRLKLPRSRFLNTNLNYQLISTQTSQLAIEWCKNNIQSTKSRSKTHSSSSEQYIPQAGEVWLPTRLAAQYLGVNTFIIQFLVKYGLLGDARRQGRGGGYFIHRNALDDFNEKHVDSTEAGKILSIDHNRVSPILRKAGIEPVTGPGIDRNPSIYYPREKILSLLNTKNRLLRQKNIGYSLAETCNKLNVNKTVVANLIKTGILNFVDPTLQYHDFINRNEVDTFYDRYANTTTAARWLNVSTTCVFRIFNQFAIPPVSGAPIDTSTQRFYAINDIEKHFFIPGRKKLSHHDEHPPFVKVADILKKYEIGTITFGRLFLRSGFTTPIKFRYMTYLVQSDINKIERILDKYCTHSQGDKYLNQRICTRILLKNKEIKTYYPLKGYCEYPMINRAELHDYIASHVFS